MTETFFNGLFRGVEFAFILFFVVFGIATIIELAREMFGVKDAD